MNNSPAVANTHNWRTHPEFLEFLRFEFSFEDASPQAKHQVMTLLPVALAEDRFVGAIKTTLLSEALRAFNRPPLYHYFNISGERWRFVGSAETPTLRVVGENGLTVVFGRLKRDLTIGAFCNPPHQEMMKNLTNS